MADGTATSWKCSCARPAARNPIRSEMGSTRRPGVSLGTMPATERPPSVPKTRNTPADWAQLIHFLPPFSTKPCALGVNSVTKDCMALPAPGSVRAKAPIISPVARAGSQRRRCSIVPHLRSTMDTMAWTVRTPVKADDPLPNASFSKPNVTVSHPWPPYSGGRLQPR